MNSQCISSHIGGSRSWGAMETLTDGRKSIVLTESSWILAGILAGVAVHSAGDTSSWTFSCSGTWGGSTLPRRVASSPGVGEVLCSSPMGLKRETSTISSPLRAIREPCTFVVSTLNHRELLGRTLTPQCRPAVPGLRPGSSPVSQPRNPLGCRHQCG